MLGAKDLITNDNVVSTRTEGKYVCFLLKNGFTVKLNPNEISDKGSGVTKQGGQQ